MYQQYDLRRGGNFILLFVHFACMQYIQVILIPKHPSFVIQDYHHSELL